MSGPAVSVIVPIYNAEAYLDRCLRSICSQTLENIEIICVNDASQDHSLEIIQSFARKDDRIKCIDLKENGGESHARNVGIAHASGEYIGSVDNDDFIDINFFEVLYNKAKKEDSDIVKGNCVAVEDSKIFCFSFENDAIARDKFNFFCRWWTAIYRTKLITENHITFPESIILGGDLVFLYNALTKCKKLSVINGTLYHYIRRADSGDSTILPTEKVASVLEAHKIISNIYNDAYGQEMSERQYILQYLRIFNHILFDILFQCTNTNDQYSCLRCLNFILKNCKVPVPDSFISATADNHNYALILNLLANEAYPKLLNYVITRKKMQDTVNAIGRKRKMQLKS